MGTNRWNSNSTGLLAPTQPIESVPREDAEIVSELVREIESRVLTLAARVGAAFEFHLTEIQPVEGQEGLALVGRLAEIWLNGFEQVMIARHAGSWGLWYRKVMQNQPVKESLLRDAPLEVRERFLRVSTRFVEEYATRHAARLEALNRSLEVGYQGVAYLDELLARSGGSVKP